MNDQLVDRVLQVHTRYRQAGGEDGVIEAEKRLLENAGGDVRQVIFDNADLRESQSLVGDFRLAASAIWSRSAKRRVERALDVRNQIPARDASGDLRETYARVERSRWAA